MVEFAGLHRIANGAGDKVGELNMVAGGGVSNVKIDVELFSRSIFTNVIFDILAVAFVSFWAVKVDNWIFFEGKMINEFAEKPLWEPLLDFRWESGELAFVDGDGIYFEIEGIDSLEDSEAMFMAEFVEL